ncbi:hypothetical protein [Carnimonas bestiolae]
MLASVQYGIVGGFIERGLRGPRLWGNGQIVVRSVLRTQRSTE